MLSASAFGFGSYIQILMFYTFFNRRTNIKKVCLALNLSKNAKLRLKELNKMMTYYR